MCLLSCRPVAFVLQIQGTLRCRVCGQCLTALFNLSCLTAARHATPALHYRAAQTQSCLASITQGCSLVHWFSYIHMRLDCQYPLCVCYCDIGVLLLMWPLLNPPHVIAYLYGGGGGRGGVQSSVLQWIDFRFKPVLYQIGELFK